MAKAKPRTKPAKNQSKIKSRVQETAEKQGIKSSYELQKLLDVAPTVAMNLWYDDVTRFSVETLELLCEKFSCDVGDLLVYAPNESRNKSTDKSESEEGQQEPEGDAQDTDTYFRGSVSDQTPPPEGQPDDKRVSVKELMSKFNKGESTIFRWLKQGHLKGEKEKRGWIIYEKDVTDFENSQFFKESVK